MYSVRALPASSALRVLDKMLSFPKGTFPQFLFFLFNPVSVPPHTSLLHRALIPFPQGFTFNPESLWYKVQLLKDLCAMSYNPTPKFCFLFPGWPLFPSRSWMTFPGLPFLCLIYDKYLEGL